MNKNLPYRNIERIIKGFANHRRIQIIELLEKTPELSVSELTEKLKIDFRTASEHIRKLTIAGVVMKRSDGNNVRHALTDRGISILSFCRTLV